MRWITPAITITVLCVLALAPAGALAWDDCPYGLEDDPYPGECWRYADSDGNGICDHSEESPEEREGTNTTAPAASTSGSGLAERYNVLPILAVVATLYGVTYLLALSGKLALATHRKLWNWALLASFLVAGALGVLMAFSLDFGWKLPFNNAIFIHVELGIAMAAVAFFHTAWHWRYYFGPSLKAKEGGDDGCADGKRKGRR